MLLITHLRENKVDHQDHLVCATSNVVNEHGWMVVNRFTIVLKKYVVLLQVSSYTDINFKCRLGNYIDSGYESFTFIK